MATGEMSQKIPVGPAVPHEAYLPHLQPTTTCTFRTFSFTPATRTLVLRGTFVLVSKILSVGTLQARGDREFQSALDWKGP